MYRSQRMLPHFRLQPGARLEESAEQIAIELRIRLGSAVQKCVCPDVFGAWLSGGLDSSALVALARPWTKKLHTFAGGLPGAPDLHFARAVAEYLGTEHHEIMLSPKDLLRILPDVIYHLESFDALLVRSSIVNFMLAKAMAEYVPATLSGEGSDELFAGYEYRKQIPPDKLENELLDLTARLHNTALQRVDRCASAHGLVAHLCFLDPYVVEFALRIPTKFKLYGSVEKWILRKAIAGLLPQTVVERTKAKFWQGSGVGDLLAEHAERTITDNDFRRSGNCPTVGCSAPRKNSCTIASSKNGLVQSSIWTGWAGQKMHRARIKRRRSGSKGAVPLPWAPSSLRVRPLIPISSKALSKDVHSKKAILTRAMKKRSATSGERSCLEAKKYPLCAVVQTAAVVFV
ncbi:MAG: asparagine synthase-related protein [Kiritimatiellia bacterium]